MEEKDVVIGKSYKLIDLVSISKDSPVYVTTTMEKFFGTKDTIKIVLKGRTPDRFQALFPDGNYWWVESSWLLPIENISSNACLKKIRLIRGRIWYG